MRAVNTINYKMVPAFREHISLTKGIFEARTHVHWTSDDHHDRKEKFREFSRFYGFDVVDVLVTVFSLLTGNRKFPVSTVHFHPEVARIISGFYFPWLQTFPTIFNTLHHIIAERHYARWSNPAYLIDKRTIVSICDSYGVCVEDILLTFISLSQGETIYRFCSETKTNTKKRIIYRYTFGSDKHVNFDISDKSTWE